LEETERDSETDEMYQNPGIINCFRCFCSLKPEKGFLRSCNSDILRESCWFENGFKIALYWELL